MIGRNDSFEVIDGANNVLGEGELNDGFVIGAGIGRRLNQRTRAELELAWRANSGDTLGADPLDGHMNNISTMANVYRNLRTFGQVQPYIGAGLGFSFQNGDFLTDAGMNVDIRDEALAFQAILGIEYEVFKDANAFFEYRYFGNTETDIRVFGTGDVGEVQYQSQNLLFGFRQRF